MNEPQDHAAVRFPPPLVFVGFMVAGAGLNRWWTIPAPPIDSLVATVIGVILVVAGFVLLILSVNLFNRTGQRPEPWTPTPEIIVTGIYRYTRNPMYLGMAAIQAGIGVATVAMWILVLLPLAMLVVYWIAIRREEAYLAEKFGASYFEYLERVRRWV